MQKEYWSTVIPINTELEEMFINFNLSEYIPDYYILNRKTRYQGAEILSSNHANNNFRKIREQLELDSNYTLYSFRHTFAMYYASYKNRS